MADIDAYLRKHGFFRLWQLVQQKYVALGRVAGRVLLQSVTDEEREAIAGLLAVNLHGHTDVSVSLQDLDRALRASGFEVSLEECLARLYPNDLTPNSALKAAEADRYSRFVEWATSFGADLRLKGWITAMGAPDQRPLGYRTFLRCYQEDYAEGTSLSVAYALTALARQLNDRRTAVRLPILAAEVSGDPHRFDTNTLAGRLFLWGMMHLRQASGRVPLGELGAHETDADIEAVAGEEELESGIDLSSESVRDLYRQFGVVLDDISSTVHVAGWPGISILPVALTLSAVSTLELQGDLGLHANHSDERHWVVFAVENPSIFGAIIDGAVTNHRSLPYPIVCISGQPSIAALRLCDAIFRVGGVIYYSGDMDVKGLQIAESLALRSRGQLLPWRMSPADYLAGLREDSPLLSDSELRQLTNRPLPWEAAVDIDGSLLRAEMLRCRRRVFQENLADKLIEDYWSTATD